MNLFQVKNTIFKTECENLILDGLCCSEPIMTMRDKMIVDNYFVYGLDREKQEYTGPIVSFGILSENCEVAYVNKSLNSCCGENDCIRAKNWNEYDKGSYNEYVSSYEKVRKFLFVPNCTEEEKIELKRYITSMEKIIDDALFPIYKELFPTFFEWSSKVLE